jgi:hypothetical protein
MSDRSWLLSRSNTEYCIGFRTILSPDLYHYLLTLWNFIPGVRFTQARSDTLDLDPANWLWPEELKLVQWIVLSHETAFAWILAKRGRLDDRYFPLIKIPMVPHTPWVLRNIPIPPSSWD